MIRILTGKSRELATDALRRAAEDCRVTANTVIPNGRFTLLSEQGAAEVKDKLMGRSADLDKLASLFADKRQDIALSLTVNEARVILRFWEFFRNPTLPSLPLDGAESAAWINMVSAARARIDLHRIELGEFTHASGEALCTCGYAYRTHSPTMADGHGCITRLCDGSLVKL